MPRPPTQFGGFKVDFCVATSTTPVDLNPVPCAYSTFQATSHNAQLHYGSYTSDLAQGKYTHVWDTLKDMEAWLKQEEKKKFIELRVKQRLEDPDQRCWTEKHIYVCARQGTGGKIHYKKKFPDRDRKIPSKRTGCPCRLVVTCYPNTTKVLGHYEERHAHEIGHENACFTRLPTETRLRIAEMLRMGITHQKIVCALYNGSLTAHLCFFH